MEAGARVDKALDPEKQLRLLGRRMAELRHERGLTQEQVAEAMDMSVAYISLIERGLRNPPYTTLVEISRALGVKVAVLCRGLR